jgi:putative PIN family toxin of toxin-antitoxin system
LTRTTLRVVVDTNTLVSAALKYRSTPMLALSVATENGILLRSEETAAELRDVLRREKFDRYQTREVCEAFIAQATGSAELVIVASHIEACRHPKDDKFLELAVDGNAHCIITGDADLLALHPFRGIDILTPAAFLARFGS